MRWPEPIWPRAIPTSVVVGIATLGALGRRMKAPGTWGSLAGLLYFTACYAHVSVIGVLIASAIGAYLAVGFCGEAEVRMGVRDPGSIVLDEVIAIPLCFLGWHSVKYTLGVPAWAVFLLGFALFRFYDIAKPFGIRRLQRLPGGWGVVLDDTAAALAACATLHVGAWAWTLR